MSEAKTWRPLFLEFIQHLQIDSKETGVGPLQLWGSQERFLDEICNGLDAGVRYFICLKARQLGISTISLAVTLFWLMVHEGTQGALIVDDESNKEKFRVLLDRYMQSLPRGLRVNVVKHNRNVLALKNGSNLDYLVAGKKKGNVTLGQSRGLNFVHATEVGSYGSEEGLASLMSSLARQNPNRLYMFESTAHGHNLFHDMWHGAHKDDLTKKAFFIGWWSNPLYAFARDTEQFKRYWDGELEPDEKELIDQVRELYGHRITAAQIAWHRYMRSEEILDENLMNQNFPWTEDQAFIATGRSFFPLSRINDDFKFITGSEAPFLGYAYHLGDQFTDTQVVQVDRPDHAELKVWEEPSPYGTYVIGVDPAYGRADYKDRHAIEVLRCYADKLVQVAEYATDEPETYQVAWVLAHLAGVYKNAWINLEINGPGPAIMLELKHLRQLLDSGYLRAQAAAAGMFDVFSAVRYYLYHRPDSMGAGYVYAWKTTADNKLLIMNQLRDTYALRQLRVRSLALLDEMEHVVQDGGSIEAQGTHKDDRTFAMALAVKTWADWVRASMIGRNETYDKMEAYERQQRDSPRATMMSSIITDFFKRVEDRREAAAEARSWEGIPADWDTQTAQDDW